MYKFLIYNMSQSAINSSAQQDILKRYYTVLFQLCKFNIRVDAI